MSSFLGENSAASYLRQAGGADSPMSKDIVPALGLRNDMGQYPFINVHTEDEKRQEFVTLLPTRQEILSFYYVWRSISFPLCPLLVDTEDFESRLGDYLESLTGKNSRTHTFSNTREGASRTALLLAILASGAQYSDRGAQERRRIYRDLSKRSFHALRLANFLLRPMLDSIQAMVILGSTLQNDGNADAAWSLLGTTTRLAQSLGLHSEDSQGLTETCSARDKSLRQKMWLTLAQQDCFLSLYYDRRTALAYIPFVRPVYRDESQGLNFQEVMWELSRIGFQILATRTPSSSPTEASLQTMRGYLGEIDQLMTRASTHLQGKLKYSTLQQRAELFLLSQHRSFAVAAICRPTFKKFRGALDSGSSFQTILNTGKQALVQVVESFLDLRAISVYPTRSWNCIHEALSSALLLTIFEETRKSRTISLMQGRLIDVLLSMDRDDAGPGRSDTNALTSSHFKALKVLQGLMREESQGAVPESSQDAQSSNPMKPNGKDQPGPESGLDGPSNVSVSDFLQYDGDLASMTFLDSFISGLSQPMSNNYEFAGVANFFPPSSFADRSAHEDDLGFLDWNFGV